MNDFREPSQLLIPLATPAQLEISASQVDGVSRELENSVRFAATNLIQSAGVLLHLPQDIIAQAIILVQRYWTGSEGGSLLEEDAQDVVTAGLYLAAKPSAHSVPPRQVLTTCSFLVSLPAEQLLKVQHGLPMDMKWSFSETEYVNARERLYRIESQMLRLIGFQTHMALPYTLCVNYLQTLGLLPSEEGAILTKAVFKLLNGALYSPQLLYLTHQPSALATAAIYLAAKHVQLKIADSDWWEIFDVDREELGFLVVAFTSLDSFALAEATKWKARSVPLTIQGLLKEMQHEQTIQG